MLLAVTIMPAVAYQFSAVAPSGQTLCYNIVGGDAQVTYGGEPRYSNITGSLTIPSTVSYNGVTYSVTSIDNYAFDASGSGNAGLISVTIPNTVTSIGYRAFYSNTGLTSVSIPNSITSIGGEAFGGCYGLTSVTLPNSLSEIGYGVFNECRGLTSVTLGNSVTSIGGYAFYCCSSLTSITIPNTVTEIGNCAFQGCTNLNTVILPNSLISIDNYAFSECNKLTSVTLGNSVTTIGIYAFSACNRLSEVRYTGDIADWCGINFSDATSNPLYYAHNLYINNSVLTDLAIPNSITEIKNYTFYNAYCLNSISIPSSITSIGEYSFGGCVGICGPLEIPNTVTTIGQNAFRNVKYIIYEGEASGSPWGALCTDGYIEDVFLYRDATKKHIISCCPSATGAIAIPSTVETIGYCAFMGCTGITSISIPNSVVSIGDYAFYECSGLTSVNIPNSVTEIGYATFASCTALSTISIPNTIVSIGNYAFYGCSSLDSVALPNSITSLRSYSFAYCESLTSVTIPNSVTEIKDRAFIMCSALTTVTIGSGVTSIGTSPYGAFDYDSAITKIISKNPTPPIIVEDEFYGVNTDIPVYVPCGSSSAYSSAEGWSRFSNFIETMTFSIAVSSADEGMGTAQIVTEPTCENPQASVSATANNGYRFDHWNDGNTDNPRTITVMSDIELTAYFSPIGEPPATTYNVTVQSADLSMGDVIGGGTYAEGSQISVSATAHEGYRFDHWNDGNTDNPRTITVMSDIELTAYFSPIGEPPATTYTVTVQSADPAMGSVIGGGSYVEGSETTVSATANNGYRFDHWNDGNTDNPRTITVTENIELTAYFVATGGTQGIDDITSDQIKIYSRSSEIVIEGCENGDVLVYDVMGRIVHKGRIEAPIHVNNIGVYMVKVGNQPPRKVVVR